LPHPIDDAVGGEVQPEPFGMALRGAKAAVDPRGILNPGVLLPP